MTNEEAISVLQFRIKLPDYGSSYGSVCEADYQHEAIDTAIAALRAQQENERYGDEAEGRLNAICEQCQIGYSDRLFLRDLLDAWEAECERENPKPLTLDELREMDGEPVWVVPNRGIAKWYLVDVANDACETCDMDVVDFELYGPENKSYGWLAYRYKKES